MKKEREEGGRECERHQTVKTEKKGFFFFFALTHLDTMETR